MIPIDENKYKPDFDISESYIKFSSELLRLSLLAMGGFGSLVLYQIKIETQPGKFLQDPSHFLISMGLFGICAGITLVHRFFATDCMSWYIAWLRANVSGDALRAKKEREGLYKRLRLSRYALILAEIFFSAAVIFFMVAMYELLK